eukprot:TRINITY_DN3542_c0_g3_i3.p1 TRINITY_DN3542_c0_g3~~TRINITY_DN3542_c0_g3_i3.p1  ORF type:complete len:102 (+),score=27.53 TRINITY_DN3542_c0_g3_i3:145-450(+)
MRGLDEEKHKKRGFFVIGSLLALALVSTFLLFCSEYNRFSLQEKEAYAQRGIRVQIAKKLEMCMNQCKSVFTAKSAVKGVSKEEMCATFCKDIASTKRDST